MDIHKEKIDFTSFTSIQIHSKKNARILQNLM